MSNFILETDRTILRELEDNDFDALKTIIHNPDEKTTDAYIHRWLNWCKDCYQNYGFGLWAVMDKETHKIIGNCGVSMQFIDDAWRPEIGYHIHEDYRNKGYGKEVSRAIKDYFFTHFDYDEVYSYMRKDNVASYKTAEANGMTYLHLFKAKDGAICRVYKITREAWLASQK